MGMMTLDVIYAQSTAKMMILDVIYAQSTAKTVRVISGRNKTHSYHQEKI